MIKIRINNFKIKMIKKIKLLKIIHKLLKLKEQQEQLELDNIHKINQIVNNHLNMHNLVQSKRILQKNQKSKKLNKSSLLEQMRVVISI